MEQEKCLVELDEILKHLDSKYLDKIPIDIRNSISEGKNRKYNWTYDENKKLNEQKINRKTIAMLSYLNMEYLLNDEQKELMKEIHYQNEKKFNLSKQNNNNISNLENKEIEHHIENATQVNMLVKTQPTKWYEKIMNFFKSRLKNKN